MPNALSLELAECLCMLYLDTGSMVGRGERVLLGG